jgi:hypothetical protein
MEQILYLEVDDDILTVRDRLSRAQAKHVLLVVPAGCGAFKRTLDLRLLRRQAAALHLDIALITDSSALRDKAVAEGLTVFSKLSIGRRIARRQLQWRKRDLPGLEGLVERLRQQRPKWWNWALGPIVIALVLAVLAATALAIWPSATITVVPAREAVGVSVWVEADPSTRFIDWERNRVPARVVQIEVVERGEVETTGVANVAGERAGGGVLFVNTARREVRIPADTIVSTSAGTPVRFRTTQLAVVDSLGRVRVSIQALEGGPGGNVRANMVNRVEGDLALTLRVTNERPTGGGTTDQVRRVTHGDKQQVSDLLATKVIQKGHTDLTALLDGEFLPIETMWINESTVRTNFDHHVDDQSDTLAMEMRAVVGGLAVSTEAAEEVARYALRRQVRGGFRLVPETVHVSRGAGVEVNDETGNVRFVMDGVGLMKADIDVPMLLKAIRGRPIDEALAYMRQTLPAEAEPNLTIDPEWMPRVPWMVFRIAVVEREPSEEIARALPGS